MTGITHSTVNNEPKRFVNMPNRKGCFQTRRDHPITARQPLDAPSPPTMYTPCTARAGHLGGGTRPETICGYSPSSSVLSSVSLSGPGGTVTPLANEPSVDVTVPTVTSPVTSACLLNVPMSNVLN